MPADHHPFRNSPTPGNWLLGCLVILSLTAAAFLFAVAIFALLSYY